MANHTFGFLASVTSVKELGIIKKSLLESSKAKIQVPGRVGIRHSTGALDIKFKDDYRRYSACSTAGSTPEPPTVGYDSITSRDRNSPGPSYSGVVNFRKTPSKPLRKSLSPPDSEVIPERPQSPRDIAKAFEAKAKETSRVSFEARNRPVSPMANYPSNNPYGPGASKPSNPGPSVPISRRISPTSSYSRNASNTNNLKPHEIQQISSSRTPTPEIINPLEEFTNYANNVMNNYEEPGPYNFQGMLRKTNSNIRKSEEPLTPPPMPILYANKLPEKVPNLNIQSKTVPSKFPRSAEDQRPSQGPLKTKVPSPQVAEVTEDPENLHSGSQLQGHWSPNPYPLPGLASKSDFHVNINNGNSKTPKVTSAPIIQEKKEESHEKSICSQEEGKRNSVGSITIIPGFIIEGIVEDL